VFSFGLQVIYVVQVVVIYDLHVARLFFEQYKDIIIMVSMNDEVVTMIHKKKNLINFFANDSMYDSVVYYHFLDKS
jgi:hypothetical protein